MVNSRKPALPNITRGEDRTLGTCYSC